MTRVRTTWTTMMLAGLLGLAACNNSTSEGPAPDFTMLPDLTVLPDLTELPDMTKLLNCIGVVGCIQKCKDVPCQTACLDHASPSASAKLLAIQACGLKSCMMKDDAGVQECTSNTDTSMTCQTCIAGAAGTAACSAELTDCLTDT